jgi:hypothetical protein
MTATRTTQYKGRTICISGASKSCLVWVDDKMVLGDFRFGTIQRARAAAVAYINRHTT